MAESPEELIVPIREVKRFAFECFVSVGCPRAHADTMSDVLTDSDYRGLYSHGLNRLETFLSEIKKGVINFRAGPKIIKESISTAWVDGQNALGPVIASYCMDLAIAKCKYSGVAVVSVRGSNNYGSGTYYSNKALSRGYIGIALTNATPFLTPTRAKKAALGTNPISVSAPAVVKDDIFCLDMSTTVASAGKIEMQKRKRQRIPEGWALNAYGLVETDPDLAFKAARLLPLGGLEITGGHKGTGLAMMVEIFCGILAGAQYGPQIRKWGDSSHIADLGHCFIALNPRCFAPGFEERMSDLMNMVRKLTPAVQGFPVLVPGDPERLHMKITEKQGGIKYVSTLLDSMRSLAAELKIKPLDVKRI